MIKTFREVKQRAKNEDIGKRDELISVEDIWMDSRGNLKIKDDSYRVTDYALGQIVKKVASINDMKGAGWTSYFKDCAPKLRAKNFNNWKRNYLENSNESDDEWLIRRKNDLIRGVLSDKYSILDNSKLIEIIENNIDHSRLELKYGYLSRDNMHLRFIRKDLKEGEGKDALFAGWNLSNGEVGSSSINVEFLIFQLICTNGMMGIKSYDDIFRKRHYGIKEPKLINDIQESIHNFDEDKAAESLELFRKARDKEIDFDLDTIFNAIQNDVKKIDDRTANAAKERVPNFLDDLFHIDQYSVISGITQAARDLYEGDKRKEVEKAAGTLLGENSVLNKDMGKYILEDNGKTAGEKYKELYHKEE